MLTWRITASGTTVTSEGGIRLEIQSKQKLLLKKIRHLMTKDEQELIQLRMQGLSWSMATRVFNSRHNSDFTQNSLEQRIKVRKQLNSTVRKYLKEIKQLTRERRMEQNGGVSSNRADERAATQTDSVANVIQAESRGHGSSSRTVTAQAFATPRRPRARAEVVNSDESPRRRGAERAAKSAGISRGYRIPLPDDEPTWPE